MPPELIPCITTTLQQGLDEHLISPTRDKPFVKAKKQTIVDCFTYGLKLNRHINPIEHYYWYIDFVMRHQYESDIIFVAPDWDWLDHSVCTVLTNNWLMKVKNVKVLTVPGTLLFKKLKDSAVGYALQVHQSGPVHPEWTHSFSKHFRPIVGQTKRWTYDSINGL